MNNNYIFGFNPNTSFMRNVPIAMPVRQMPMRPMMRNAGSLLRGPEFSGIPRISSLFSGLGRGTSGIGALGAGSRAVGGVVNGASKLTFTGILNGASKTLGVINQALPIFHQAKPIWNNAKTMFRVVKEINSSDSTPRRTNTNNLSTDVTVTNSEITEQKKEENNNNSLTFFI